MIGFFCHTPGIFCHLDRPLLTLTRTSATRSSPSMPPPLGPARSEAEAEAGGRGGGSAGAAARQLVFGVCAAGHLLEHKLLSHAGGAQVNAGGVFQGRAGGRVGRGGDRWRVGVGRAGQQGRLRYDRQRLISIGLYCHVSRCILTRTHTARRRGRRWSAA